jgi:hypothetical protein
MSFTDSHQQSLPQHSGPVQDGDMQSPPCYSGEAPSCRFRGGRRGNCRRGRKFSFMHRFIMRFVVFFVLSTIYTERSIISSGFMHAGSTIAAHSPMWIIYVLATLESMAAIPFSISTYVGLIFYSAFFSLIITSLRQLAMKRRKARFQRMKMMMASSGQPEGRRHRHHCHHDSAQPEAKQDLETSYHDDTKSGESEPLIKIQA